MLTENLCNLRTQFPLSQEFQKAALQDLEVLSKVAHHLISGEERKTEIREARFLSFRIATQCDQLNIEQWQKLATALEAVFLLLETKRIPLAGALLPLTSSIETFRQSINLLDATGLPLEAACYELETLYPLHQDITSGSDANSSTLIKLTKPSL